MKHNKNDMPIPAQYYEICLKGQLDAQWADWFEGLTITLEEGNNTLLSGPVADQAALHGLLKKIRDLGMTLVSVYLVSFEETYPHHFKIGEKMSIKTTAMKKIDTKVLLSTLWVVIMINMLKADILSLNIPDAAEEVARTSANAGVPIPQLMLIGAVMGQVGIAMIVLSRVLTYSINRWVNIVASIITIAYIWGGMASYPHYIFIATVETLCLLLALWFAWTWRNIEA